VAMKSPACRKVGLRTEALTALMRRCGGTYDDAELEEAFRRHSIMMPMVAVDPAFRAMRGEPRFRKIVAETGLGIWRRVRRRVRRSKRRCGGTHDVADGPRFCGDARRAAVPEDCCGDGAEALAAWVD